MRSRAMNILRAAPAPPNRAAWLCAPRGSAAHRTVRWEAWQATTVAPMPLLPATPNQGHTTCTCNAVMGMLVAVLVRVGVLWRHGLASACRWAPARCLAQGCYLAPASNAQTCNSPQNSMSIATSGAPSYYPLPSSDMCWQMGWTS